MFQGGKRTLSMWEEKGDSLSQLLSEWINYGGDCRAGPWLRPGLLIMLIMITVYVMVQLYEGAGVTTLGGKADQKHTFWTKKVRPFRQEIFPPWKVQKGSACWILKQILSLLDIATPMQSPPNLSNPSLNYSSFHFSSGLTYNIFGNSHQETLSLTNCSFYGASHLPDHDF